MQFYVSQIINIFESDYCIVLVRTMCSINISHFSAFHFVIWFMENRTNIETMQL